MKNRTTRLLRQLADIRRAQRCTALRAARAAADVDRALAEPAEDEAGQDDDTQEAPPATPGERSRPPR